MSGSAKPEIGVTGRAVVENIRRLRAEQRLSYTAFSAKLAEIGRVIPPLGLRRMLELERRIDVDELEALATVLGVSIEALLSKTAADEYRSRVLRWLMTEDDYRNGRERPSIGPFLPGVTGILINGAEPKTSPPQPVST